MSEFERVGPSWAAVLDQEFLALVGAVDKAVNDFVLECGRRWETPDTSSSFRQFAVEIVEAWEADISGVAAHLRKATTSKGSKNIRPIDDGSKRH